MPITFENCVVAPSLEMLFRDKTTGAPLTGGKVYFYKEGTTTPKNVYTISGTPPSYMFTALPNPVTLNAAGAFADDMGNNVLPYYYPYDETDESIIERYSIKVTDSSGTTQFTRDGWPVLTEESTTDKSDFINYVENPQFLTYNRIAEADVYQPVETQIYESDTPIAPGGWWYRRGSSGTGGIDFVSFEDFTTYSANPPASPNAYVVCQCTTPGSSYDYRYLSKRWYDVNKFQNTNGDESKVYQFVFWANAVASAVEFDIKIIRYFGAGGGSVAPETVAASQTMAVGINKYSFEIDFGDQTGVALGTTPSYVEVAISLDPTASFNFKATDFILTDELAPGQTVNSFPVQTNSVTLTDSIMGYLEDPQEDNSDLYLPLVRTREGVIADSSVIGRVDAFSCATVPDGYLLADGTSYPTYGYSALGIPYLRLQEKYWSNTIYVPRYGTGADYFTAIVNATDDTKVAVILNTPGAYTAMADGSTTGLSYIDGSPGRSAPNSLCLQSSGSVLEVENYYYGNTGITIGNTTGWTTSIPQSLPASAPLSYFRMAIGPQAATSLSGGEYLLWPTTTSGGTVSNQYVWFTKDGAGSDPAPSPNGVVCNIVTGESAATVADKTSWAMNGYQFKEIQCVAASAMTAGGWISIYSSSGQRYAFWFEINGAGTAPAPASTRVVKVTLGGAEDAATVAEILIQTINSQFFAVPDYQGKFLVGWADSSSTYWQRYSLSRVGYLASEADGVGGLQWDTYQAHDHTFDFTYIKHLTYSDTPGTSAGIQDLAASGLATTLSSTTGFEGSDATKPLNVSVKYCIKY